jgi:hypothetical protein
MAAHCLWWRRHVDGSMLFRVLKSSELWSIGEVELQFSHEPIAREIASLNKRSDGSIKVLSIKRNSLHTSENKHYRVSHSEQV